MLLLFFGHACVGCSGVPADGCKSNVVDGVSTNDACGIGGQTSRPDEAAGTGGQGTIGSGGMTTAGGSGGSGPGSGGTHAQGGRSEGLVANGSFEWDQQPAAAFATAPPSGWTMLSVGSVGHLLHAARGDASESIPSASDGSNVAYFDSLTASSYREAQSNCFAIDANKAVAVRYHVQIPESQNPAETRAAVKLWYYQDGACTIASTLRTSDTQTAAPNTTAGVWEGHEFEPAHGPPADSAAARISIRGAYTAGPTCSDGGATCSADRIYFDDVVVWQ